MNVCARRRRDLHLLVEELRAENQRLSWENDCLRGQLSSDCRFLQVRSPLTSLAYGAASTNWGRINPLVSQRGDGSTVAWGQDQLLPLPCMPIDGEKREGMNCRYWETWCPICKRPLSIAAYKKKEDWPGWPRTEMQPKKTGKYGYVAVIWGFSTGLVLGALVLGAALKDKSLRDRVLLHTDDIPESSLELLGKLWNLRKVSYVTADARLYGTLDTRFDGVFTKMHALALDDYAKVLVLDLDISVVGCLDELFELTAPAALHRRVWGSNHKSRIDGRWFFRGEAGQSSNDESNEYAWGQAGGINAGVMLLEPDRLLYKRVMKELASPLHPSHVPGSGPEQDYLSRLLAPWWTNISVCYNYQ